MHTQTYPFRLAAAVAGVAVLLSQVTPRQALAQGAPPPPPYVGGPQQQAVDPPERVGRLARISGAVSFHTQDDAQWNPASLNYPVTGGNAFWTEPDAQAEIQVSASRIALAPTSELDITSLTDTEFLATQPQGEVYARLRQAGAEESYALQTPRGLISLAVPGRYAVAAGDTENPTRVIVVEGSAHLSGPGIDLDIGPNQMARVTGSEQFQGDVGPAERDPFLSAMLDSERPPPGPSVAPPPVVAAMPGGSDLAQYGTWQDSPDYGEVWYPQVATDWVPYRDGNWAYVAPWGWTWVDRAPWGFAPFHYGRWAEIHGRWGWIPGRYEGPRPRPVYAPALVTFLGVAAVAGAAGAALAAGRIGWLPLGPREPYHPWYRASDRYYRQVNVTHVTNITTINRNVTINNFANRRAATVVPTATMIASRPVATSFQRVDPGQLAHARPVIGTQPLRPAPTTFGVTPAVARELNMPRQVAGSRPAAPGPSFQPRPAAATAAIASDQAARPSRPPLHNPGQQPVPASAGTRPITGTPQLAAPGGRPPGATSEPRPGLAPTTPPLAMPASPAGPAATPHGGPAASAATAGTPALTSPASRPPGLRGPGSPGQPPNRYQPATATPGAAPNPAPSASPPGGGTVATPSLRPAPSLATPTPQDRTARPGVVQPAAPSRPMPSLATPTPTPQVHTPPPGAIQPATPSRPTPSLATPAPQVHSPAPGAVRPVTPFHPTAPSPTMTHVAPAAPQVAHPAATVSAPPAMRPAAPPPQVHAAPPPQVRAAPPPQAHAAPQPAPTPRAPPPAQASGGAHKRPGEP